MLLNFGHNSTMSYSAQQQRAINTIRRLAAGNLLRTAQRYKRLGVYRSFLQRRGVRYSQGHRRSFVRNTHGHGYDTIINAEARQFSHETGTHSDAPRYYNRLREWRSDRAKAEARRRAARRKLDGGFLGR